MIYNFVLSPHARRTHHLLIASTIANKPAATKIKPAIRLTSSPATMIPAMRQSAPMTPRAIRPERSRLGLKKRLIRKFSMRNFNCQAVSSSQSHWLPREFRHNPCHGFAQAVAYQPALYLGFNDLGKHRYRLHDLWLEAKGRDSISGRIGNDVGVGLYFQRITDVADVHHHHRSDVVAVETGILKKIRDGVTPSLPKIIFGF